MIGIATITNEVYNKSMRDKSNWNLVDFNCLNCGIVVRAFPSRNVKYCSDCSKNRKVEIKCEACGVRIQKHPSRMAKFCSRKCWIKSQKGHKVKLETRRRISATKLSKPVTNDIAGRKRANTYLYPIPKPCEECGITERIDRHHIDKNPQNNDKSNIKFLCKLHHQRLHRNWEHRKAYLKKNGQK